MSEAARRCPENLAQETKVAKSKFEHDREHVRIIAERIAEQRKDKQDFEVEQPSKQKK
jgi:hypothetical protein